MKRTLLIIVFTALCFNAVAQSQDEKLDSLYYSLPEAMVTGEKPVVKADKGKLIYDLPHIIRDLPVDNVYDAIKELPGVTERDGSFTLAGRGVKVVIDGKVTNMSSEQLNTLLKSIPASSIANAEVMYSAPARYQVRGAMINITLKKADDSIAPVVGEVGGKWQYDNRHAFQERASLIVNKGKFSGDILYSHTHGKSFSETGSEAHHSLNDGTVHEIIDASTSESQSHRHNWRVGADYNFGQKHSLSGVYTGSYAKGTGVYTTTGFHNAVNNALSVNQMHNGRIDYDTPFGLSAGAEFTSYKAPIIQALNNPDGSNILTANDNQNIRRWKAFVSQEHNTKNGWGINYGVNFNMAKDDSWQKYTGTGELPGDMSAVQRENILNIYAGFNKSFGDKLMMDVSLAGERYESEVWKKWDIYPNAVLLYTPNKDNLFQLYINGNRDYPEYWAVKSATNISSGGYSEIIGNPDLSPASSWFAQFIYLFRNKYMLAAWFGHTDNYFIQTQYLDPNRLKSIFKWVNFDYQQTAGLQLAIPFKAGQWLDSRLTVTGQYQHEKDSDFYDMSFDRHKVYLYVILNNSFTISRKPHLIMNVNGSYNTAAIQGLYDMPQSGNLDMSLTWRFLKEKANLTVGCYDVLETQGISPYMNYGKQVVYNHYPSYREFKLTFSYRFGAYKDKERKEVDTNRFR
ncbi:MAG: outer membrane beta-barrel protein [Bacteroidales bacterium]|nr:outer membrane beta-barrel protein [Bacteroidales bacterium]